MPQTRKALPDFEEGSAVKLLADTVKIYSPTGRESAAAKFLSQVMRAHGFRRVRSDSAGNVIGEVGRGNVKVLLCGHMDTVPGRIPVTRTPEKIAGRGSVDAKAALCAMLVAASRLSRDESLKVTMACVVGEEGDGAGTKALAAGGSGYDFAIFGEPGGANRLTIGYRGRMTLRVSVDTEGGHAGSSWAHRSAFDAGSELVARLRERAKGLSKADDHFRSVSVTLTLFAAGEYRNVVPAHAHLTFDVRVPPGSSCSIVEGIFASEIEAYSRQEGVQMEHFFEERTEPYESPPSGLLPRAFQRGILLKSRNRPVLLRKTGTGDMNTFAMASGIECVTYGAGDAALSHTSREAVQIDDYLASIEVLGEALRQISLLSKGGRSSG